MTHYFQTPDLDSSRPLTYEFTFAQRRLTVVSDAGVFSHGALDKATAHLLHYLDEHHDEIDASLPAGDLIDLGCGAGPLALALAVAFPRRKVWAIDVNARAVALTRENAKRNALENIQVALPDDGRIPEHVAMLWSNPPIRIGKTELHSLLLSWLGRMTSNGVAYLVVSKNLGGDSLQRWLRENTYDVERVASKSGFRIFRCSHGFA